MQRFQEQEGYVPKLKKGAGGKWEPDGLTWDKVTDKAGNVSYKLGRDYRLAQSKEYSKANPVPKGSEGKKATNNHHMTPDEIMRSSPIFQELFREGLISPDRASNMIHLAVNKQTLADLRSAGFTMSDITHYTSHPAYTELVEMLLNERFAKWAMRERFPLDAKSIDAKKLQKFVMEFDKYMIDSFFSNPERLKNALRADGSLGYNTKDEELV